MLVKADYSQIELRIAAKISGDKKMLEAYERARISTPLQPRESQVNRK
jgi:hypothetical protein